MLTSVITFILSNFSLIALLLGFVTATVSVLRTKPTAIAERYLSHFLFFSIGSALFYNFVIHVFFGEMAARFIGFANSPFQTEVGVASLGMAVNGFIAAFYSSRAFRLATLMPVSFFLWGAAAGHIVQMVVANNFTSGNAGLVFYTDLLIPMIGLALFWTDFKAMANSDAAK